MMKRLLDLTGRIHAVRTETITLNRSFSEVCRAFSDLPGTVVLLSGGNLDCSRHHILAALPWLTVRGKGRFLEFFTGGQTLRLEADPFDALRELSAMFLLEGGVLPEPVCTGLFGYLAYDLKDHLETLPRTSMDDLCLPDMMLYAPSFILVHDRTEDRTRLHAIERVATDGIAMPPERELFLDLFNRKTWPWEKYSVQSSRLQANFGKADYIAAIDQIRDYIASGDVYQVNLAQRFEIPFRGNPYRFFHELFAHNPAPFFSYIHADDHVIISSSPERFLKRSGPAVETRPIKGTRPRGIDDQHDRRLRDELLQSPKDAAELAMIVDLLRNDLGKVCCAGSVNVVEHRRIEAYHNVYHLVSRIEGKLEEDCDNIDLIRVAFPGGSITGCPKIRAMEIIDELEPNRRHIYTGAIGYIGFHGTMDLAVAIRTATITGGTLLFSVGGGIVYDSLPADEYEETLHKGRSLRDVFENHSRHGDPDPHVWMNGRMIPAKKAAVSVADPSFQYGWGLFETIRAQNGVLFFLSEHMERFDASWRHLFQTSPPDLIWQEIMLRTLRKNGLADRVAAVKIMAGAKAGRRDTLLPDLAVMVRPYQHRLNEKVVRETAGLDILTYPHPRQSPLADHKTLNHLFSILAGNWARSRGADEALILNPDGTVSETHSAGLMIRDGKTIMRPHSPHVLPSVMTEKVCQYLQQRGYTVESKPVFVASLLKAEEVLLANSLMGAVPAGSLDGRAIGKGSRLWIEINDHLFLGDCWRRNIDLIGTVL